MSKQANDTAVDFSGDQQPQTATDVSQTVPDKNARVDAVWQQMNKGISSDKLNSILKKSTTNLKVNLSKPSSKPSSASWMTVLGLGPKTNSPVQSVPTSKPVDKQDSVGADALKIAAAALSATKDAANMAALSGRGKIEANPLLFLSFR
ncbi:hypothetical protein R6Q57_015356 [Mikania cordata]